MFEKVLRQLFGDPSVKELKKLQPYVDDILEIYPTLEAKSDDELRDRIQVIRAEIEGKVQDIFDTIDKLKEAYQKEPDEREQTIIGNEMDALKKKSKPQVQEILDEYLPEVYAIIKDTCRRMLGMKYDVRGHETEWDMVPFDVQLIGAIALHKGMITEMATGEGKTLVAVLPLFLNALTGRNVHLVTVNDYLAQRDSEWMGPIFAFHGLTVGVIITRMDFDERKAAYSCDVTYGMNSEFGFDYLRDNMATSIEQVVQREFYYAIVDEVDSILVDEARTPLIISGPITQDKNFYDELRAPLVQLVGMQNVLTNRLLSEVRQALTADKPDYDMIAKNLLLVSRAAPRSKAFLKMMQEGDLKKLVNDTEGYYLRDKKMTELDGELFYVIEEKQNSADLAEKGRDFLSKSDPDLFLLNSLDDMLTEVDENPGLTPEQKTMKKESVTNHFLDKTEKLHNIAQLLKAYSLFEKDVDYVINDNQVVIVDEFTGRMMPGRRFSDGLHQALEAKENVKIEGGTQTFATITLQNYFRMFDKLAGMTGTAVTEESEFMEIYHLPVLPIPTNRPVSRHDHEDVIYLTKSEKYNAIIDEIAYWYERGKPVLVGTVSVEVSETLSRLLRRKKIDHNILNAKNHEREAEIIREAGHAKAVTIATNMAGRGTDIKLGETVVTNDKEFYLDDPWKITSEFEYGKPLDGLHVIGSERHESRRIDRQLRGRAGRQGDPGTSRFYLSLEDDLMRLFGSDRIAPMLIKFGVKEGEAIMHPWMTSAVEKAQRRVEEHNFDIRKQLIKYDEVMNQQREVIYSYRRNVLKGYDLQDNIKEMIKETIWGLVETTIPEGVFPEEWPLDKLINWFRSNCDVDLTAEVAMSGRQTPEGVAASIEEFMMEAYQKREVELGSEMLREIERRVMLDVVDDEWRDHLHEMDLLKDGIGLRAYANKDPLIEYKKESLDLFESLIGRIQQNVARKVFTTYILTQEQMQNMLAQARTDHSEISAYQTTHVSQPIDDGQELPKGTPVRAELKVGRNDPCPCGSGKKYKKCCGKMEHMNSED